MLSKVWQKWELAHLWDWCINEAKWKDSEVFFSGATNVIKLKRGQFVTGRQAMHRAVYPLNRKKDPSEKGIENHLKQLENLGCLVRKPTSRYTIVTICNYDTYQLSADDDLPELYQKSASVLPELYQKSATVEERQEQERTVKKAKKKKAPQAAVVFPPALDVPEFREAWANWTAYRKKRKLQKLVDMTVTRQIAACDEMGLERAVAMIEWTIQKGWQGLREPDVAFSGGTGAQSPKPPAYVGKEQP